MIFRLDLGSQVTGGAQDLAPRQLQWTALGILCAFAVVWFLRDHRTLRRYTYTAMIAGIVLVALPLVPGLGHPHQRRPDLDQPVRLLAPAGRVREGRVRDLLRGVPGDEPRHARARRPPCARPPAPPPARPRADHHRLARLAHEILVFERDLGTSLLFFGLFVAMLYIATERMSWVVIGLLLIAVGAVLAASTFGHVQARIDVWLHPFRPGDLRPQPGWLGPARGRPVLARQRRPLRHGLGRRLPPHGPVRVLRLHLRVARRGARAHGSHRHPARVPRPRRARPWRTAIGVRDGFGKLLAGGLAFVMAWQLFVVVGGITRIIPLTGLTMPFVTRAGHALPRELARRRAAAAHLRRRAPALLPAVRGQVAPRGARPGADSDRVAVVGGGAAVGALPDDAPTTVGAPAVPGPCHGPRARDDGRPGPPPSAAAGRSPTTRTSCGPRSCRDRTQAPRPTVTPGEEPR